MEKGIRKILSILAAVGLLTTSTSGVIACGNDKKIATNNDNDDDSENIDIVIDKSQFWDHKDDGSIVYNEAEAYEVVASAAHITKQTGGTLWIIINSDKAINMTEQTYAKNGDFAHLQSTV